MVSDYDEILCSLSQNIGNHLNEVLKFRKVFVTNKRRPKFIRGNNGTGPRSSCPRRTVLSEVLVRMYLSYLEIPSST